MTKPKKPEELTDEALIRRIFPKEVVQEAKRAAEEGEKRPKKAPAKRSDSGTSE